MQVFIYYFSALGVPRDEIESQIEDFLGSRGEVTGGGGGNSGGNVDVEIEGDDALQVLQDLMKFLRTLGLPNNTIVDVDGVRTPLYANP